MNKNTIYAILILVLVVLVAVFLSSKGGIDSCLRDTDCQKNYKCFNSAFSPEGADPEQRGDLLCHKTCSLDSDCTSEFPNCEEVEIWQGSVVTNYNICVK